MEKDLVQLNGIPREVSIPETAPREISPGVWLVASGESVLEVFRSPDGKLSDGNSLDAQELKVETPREKILRLRFKDTLKAGSGAAGAGAHMVRAPMPGLVRSIVVSAGDIVEKNSTLLVLEAMKMENNILAGVKGTVERVHVIQGNSVEKNAVLVELHLG